MADSQNGACRNRSGLYEVFKRLQEFAKDEYLLIGCGLGAMTVNSITNLSFPWIIGQAVDRAAKSHTSSQYRDYIFGASAILLAGSLASWVRVYCLGTATDRISARMKSALFQSYMVQDAAFYDEAESGELVTVLDKDVNEAAQVFTERLSATIRSLNSSVNGSIMLFLNSPELCGITLACVPLVGVGAMAMSMSTSKRARALRELHSTVLSFAMERLRSITTVRLNGKEKQESSRFDRYMAQCLEEGSSLYFNRGAFMSFLNLATNACLVVVLFSGGRLMARGELTAGSLTRFAIQSAFVGLGFSGLSSSYSDAVAALSAGERFLGALESSREAVQRRDETIASVDPVDEVVHRSRDSSSGSDDSLGEWEKNLDAGYATSAAGSSTGFAAVVIRDLHFRYQSRPDVPVLSGISLNAAKGSITVIVGRSGAGKSTLLSLMCGLYLPCAGSLLVAGRETRSAGCEWVRGKVGVVEQSAGLFSGTVEENILYGAPDPGSTCLDDMERVARLVNAHEFIRTLPEGYKSQVGEGGQLLSGGQRQRIALCRALIKDPPILILDEPSAALDSDNEDLLIQQLLRLKQNKCIVVFTHSDAIMSIADTLHLMEDGKILASGSYESLIGSARLQREEGLKAALSSSTRAGGTSL